MDKYSIVLLIFGVVILSGCMSPQEAVGWGQAALQSTEQARVDATRQWQGQQAQATLSAGATQFALNVQLDESARQAAQTMAALEIFAAQEELRRKGEAYAATETARPPQSTATAQVQGATATALAIAQDDEANAARRRQRWDDFWLSVSMVLIALGLFGSLILFLWLAYQMIPLFLDRLSRAGRAINTPYGVLVWQVDDRGFDSAMILNAPQETVKRFLKRGKDLVREGVVDVGNDLPAISPGGITSVSGLKERANGGGRLRSETLKFLYACRDVWDVGDYKENQIPGWRHIDGMRSGDWQFFIRVLEADGWVWAESSGTFVSGVQDIRGLIFEVESGHVNLQVPPALVGQEPWKDVKHS